MTPRTFQPMCYVGSLMATIDWLRCKASPRPPNWSHSFAHAKRNYNKNHTARLSHTRVHKDVHCVQYQKHTHTHARTRCASVFHQITASMPFKYHVCVCVCAACTVTTINSPRSNTRNNTHKKNLQQVCVSFLIELLC